jgi:hypothetical protein
MTNDLVVERDAVERGEEVVRAAQRHPRLDRVSPHHFVIRTLDIDSSFVIRNSSFHSLFTAENEMSVIPASAQAFIAWET